MDFTALGAEIKNDPAGLGYAGKTAVQVQALLLGTATGRQITRRLLPAWEILEAIVPADLAALDSAAAVRVFQILALQALDFTGANTREHLWALFAKDSQTLANLTALQKQAVSRAEELGFGKPDLGDIAYAMKVTGLGG